MINTLDDIILAADTVIDSVPQISDSTNFWMVRSKQGVFYNEYVAGGYIRFLYKGIIIKHNKTEPTYTKTSLFLCEKRRFFMARTEKGVVATI